MKYLYIANWKMNLSFNQSINFCTQNGEALQQLTQHAEIVVCPSFIALKTVADIVKNKSIMIGAQNCSEYPSGAYTGEVSALSLAEAGATYCIVGHSERRIYYHETTDIIIKKINLLYHHNIVPIICIENTKEDLLQPIFDTIAQHNRNRVIIAYEPVGSIGTGIIPEQEHLTTVFEWLTQKTHSLLPKRHVQLLYGGSINQNNIKELKKIININGFLIGGASTSFENLKNMIT